MTEIIKIPPFEVYYEEVRTFPGYNDRRGVEEIEGEIRKAGIKFSFEETLKNLRASFPEDEKIKVFEGGCGFGNTLKDIAQIARGLNIPIQTTGVTMAEQHVPVYPASECVPDVLLVGTLGNHHKKGTTGKGFHFILDFYGPLWYEAAVGCRYSQYSQEGELIIPIYRRIAAGGAVVMMLMRSMEPELATRQSLQSYEVFRKMSADRSRDYLAHEGFYVLEQKKRYVLMEKEKLLTLGNLVKAVSTFRGVRIPPSRGVQSFS